MLVVVVRVIARLPQACFVWRQQILAVTTNNAPTKMVLLPIPKVVHAARVTARLPLACFVWLQ